MNVYFEYISNHQVRAEKIIGGKKVPFPCLALNISFFEMLVFVHLLHSGVTSNAVLS